MILRAGGIAHSETVRFGRAPVEATTKGLVRTVWKNSKPNNFLLIGSLLIVSSVVDFIFSLLGPSPSILPLDRSRITNRIILLSNGKEELEFRRKLLLRVQAIGKVDTTDATIGMNLHTERLDVVGTVGSSCEIRQIELNLVPSFVQSHRHRTKKWLHSGRRLMS